MRISDWSSDVCSSDLGARGRCMKRLIPLCLLLLACAGCVRMHVYGDPQAYAAGAGETLRIATYNASLHDDAAGGLVRSEDRREGNECFSTGIPRWTPSLSKKNKVLNIRIEID